MYADINDTNTYIYKSFGSYATSDATVTSCLHSWLPLIVQDYRCFLTAYLHFTKVFTI